MRGDRAVVRRQGSVDFERAFTAAVDEGLREVGREMVDDIRRTSEQGVLRQRGYTPGPLGRRRGRGVGGNRAPTRGWPIWTGKSLQGFAWMIQRGRAAVLVFNRAVDARTGEAYPRFVEARGRHVGLLWQSRRRKFERAFGRGFGRRWRKGR